MNNTTTILPAAVQLYLWFATNLTSDVNDTSYYYLQTIGSELPKNETRCYGVYGCFSLASPWTSEYRPVSVYPEGFNRLNPVYMLYTRNNPKVPIIMDMDDPDMIKESKIDPNLKLYMICHGFTDEGNKTWVLDMKNELLDYEDSSVIVVDWGTGSDFPYPQAVANIRLVGAMTAHLLDSLANETTHRNLDHVHLIGHSLGAHLSGYVGYTLQKQFNLTLGRISGLDPAHPHFAHAHPPVRLDRSAAHYVDVVHSDSFDYAPIMGLGLTERIGHVDFFPNGGTKQPGCRKTFNNYQNNLRGFLEVSKMYISCDHVRAYHYFTDSIRRTNCPFLSITCDSPADFESGKCIECNKNGHHCIKFGFHSRADYERLVENKIIVNQTNLTTYLMTGAEKYYCRAHYRITLKIAKDGGEIGQLFVTIFSRKDGKGETVRLPLKSGVYEDGELYRIIVPGHEISNIGSIKLELESSHALFNPIFWRPDFKLRVHIDWITVESMELGQKIKVCPENGGALESSRGQIMKPSHCVT